MLRRLLSSLSGKKKSQPRRSVRKTFLSVETLEGRELMSTSPVSVALPEVSLRPGQQKVVELPASDGAGNVLSYQVADPGLVQKAFELDQQMGLSFTGNYYTSYLGDNEKWLLGAASRWYYLHPNGELWQWNYSMAGHAAQSPDQRIGVLDASFYADPTKLFNAPPPALSVNLSGRQLTLRAQPSAAGDYPINLAISSGSSQQAKTLIARVRNSAPVLDTIANQQSAHDRPVTLTLSARDADGDAVTFSAKVISAAARAYDLDQQLGLRFAGSYSTNWLGAQEKWVLGNNSQWYFITPDGSLYRWTGKTGSPAQAGTLIDKLDGAFHVNPALLHDAPRPPMSVAVAGNQLTISTARGYIGQFTVQVTASDGLATASQTFAVEFTNSAPVVDITGQTVKSGTARTIDLPATDADGDILTYSARIAGSAARAYELDQQLGLRFGGDYYTNWVGAQEKWMLGNNSQWYFIAPDGSLYNWTGKFGPLAQAGTLIATLSPSFHANPRLLHDAVKPPVSVSVSGRQLTISTPADYKGSFGVEINSADGIASTTATFQVWANPNRSPVMDLIADQKMTEKETLTVPLSATDSDGDALTFSARVLTGGEANTRIKLAVAGNELTITPNGFRGSFQVEVTAHDGQATGATILDVDVTGILTVTTASDEVNHSGVSLRDAIAQANRDAANGISDQIVFDAGLRGQTITLKQGELKLSGVGGTITIDAGSLRSAGTTVTISGNYASRIFEVYAGVHAAINYLDLSGGNVGLDSGNYGGAVLNRGTLEMIGANLSGNTANFGGAIASVGTLTVSGGSLARNTAVLGGSILTEAGTTTVVSGAFFKGDSATNGGGAIFNRGTMHILTIWVDNATADNYGGALANLGTMTVHGMTNLFNNRAVRGGGIYNGGQLTMTTGSLNYNSATRGGGVYNSGALTVNESVFHANDADLYGGGIYNLGTLSMSLSYIRKNISWGLGGGIDNGGVLTVANCLIDDNDGGGLSSSGGTTTLTNTLIAGNRSWNGVPDVYGPISGTSNLIGNGAGMTGISHGTDGNQVGTTASPLSVQGNDSALYYLSAGNLYRVGVVGELAAGVSGLAQGSDNAVYYLQGTILYRIGQSEPVVTNVTKVIQGAGKAVYYLQGRDLYQVGGSSPAIRDVVQFVVDRQGVLHVLSSATQSVWQRTDSNFVEVSGRDIAQIAMDRQGDLYALSFVSHSVWQRTASGWAEVSGRDIALMGVDNQGSLFALSFVSESVWQRTASGFVEVSGRDVQSLVLDGNGTLFVLNSDHAVRRWDRDHWTVISSFDIEQIVVANGMLYALNRDPRVFRWDRDRWTGVSEVGVIRFAFNSDGSLWTLHSNGQLSRDGSTGDSARHNVQEFAFDSQNRLVILWRDGKLGRSQAALGFGVLDTLATGVGAFSFDVDGTLNWVQFATVTPDGTLQVLGTDGDDSITVTQRYDKIHVHLNGLDVSGELTTATVQRINVYGQRGNDRINLHDPSATVILPTAAFGDEGNDTIYGGNGSDYIDGGAGDDYLVGWFADDVLIAGPSGNDSLDPERGPWWADQTVGNDTYVVRGDGRFYDFEGSGEDFVVFHRSNGEVVKVWDNNAGSDQLFYGTGSGTFGTSGWHDLFDQGAWDSMGQFLEKNLGTIISIAVGAVTGGIGWLGSALIANAAGQIYNVATGGSLSFSSLVMSVASSGLGQLLKGGSAATLPDGTPVDLGLDKFDSAGLILADAAKKSWWQRFKDGFMKTVICPALDTVVSGEGNGTYIIGPFQINNCPIYIPNSIVKPAG